MKFSTLDLDFGLGETHGHALAVPQLGILLVFAPNLSIVFPIGRDKYTILVEGGANTLLYPPCLAVLLQNN